MENFLPRALLEFVNALNSVDLPTLGKPNNTTFETHYLLFTVLENNSSFLSNNIEIESTIFWVIKLIFSISSSLKFIKTKSDI